MITSFAFHSTAFAIATDCRWPPESDATGWRIERTVVTARLASVSPAGCLHRLLVEEERRLSAFPPEEHVLHDVEVVAEREVLVDGLDPERCGLARGADPHRAPLPEDLPRVGRMDPGDALDRHRLAGAVVADQRGHLARAGSRGRRRRAPAPARSSSRRRGGEGEALRRSRVLVIESLLPLTSCRSSRASPRTGEARSGSALLDSCRPCRRWPTCRAHRSETVIVLSLTTVSAMFSFVTQIGFV